MAHAMAEADNATATYPLRTARKLTPDDIDSIFEHARSMQLVNKYIVYGEQSSFILFVGATCEAARFSRQEAVAKACDYLQQSVVGDSALVLTFAVFHSEKAQSARFATVIRVTPEVLDTLNFILQEERSICDHGSPTTASADEGCSMRSLSSFFSLRAKSQYLPMWGSSRPRQNSRSCKHSRLYVAGGALIICTLAFVAFGYYLANRSSGIYIRYDVRNSKGPRYQLYFDHHNVTNWDTREKQLSFTSNTEWELRIDDQAMIPAHLLTPDEERYQQWFRARYPEKELIRQQKLYLNQTFLSDPYALQVLSDESFHMAQCVLALRRYWWAKESGTHVCPRDIDYMHMKHCLDSLDIMAFPDGPRGPIIPDPEPGDIRLIWETKVCF